MKYLLILILLMSCTQGKVDVRTPPPHWPVVLEVKHTHSLSSQSKPYFDGKNYMLSDVINDEGKPGGKIERNFRLRFLRSEGSHDLWIVDKVTKIPELKEGHVVKFSGRVLKIVKLSSSCYVQIKEDSKNRKLR